MDARRTTGQGDNLMEVLMKLQESISDVRVGMAELRTQMQQVLAATGRVDALESRVQAVETHVESLRMRMAEDKAEADKRVLRYATVAGAVGTAAGSLLMLALFVIEHWRK